MSEREDYGREGFERRPPAARTGDVPEEGRAHQPLTDMPEEGRARRPVAMGFDALIPEADQGSFRQRWESIQASFVDDPRTAVEEANALVADVSDRIVDGFRHQRGQLESRWDRGDEVGTEELRQSLRLYREFFDRLLAL